MTTDVFFDTNVVVYLVDADTAKADRSEAILKAGGYVSVQVLNEFIRVATAKKKYTIAEAKEVLATVRSTCSVLPLTLETHEHGVRIADRYGYSIFDCMIIAAALLAR